MRPGSPSLSESAFLDQIAMLAKLHQWRVAHFRAGRTAGGWRTPCQYDAKGFPDLVLVRERILWVEVKRENGQLTDEQALWSQALFIAGADVRIWYPSDWPEIEETLR